MSETPDRAKLTFSQAEGLAPLPQPLKLGELSPKLRSLLWAFVYEEILMYRYYSSGEVIIGPWKTILRNKHVLADHKPADEFTNRFSYWKEHIKCIILYEEYNDLFDFIQFVMRHPECPQGFKAAVRAIFRDCQAAYTVVDEGPTIVPVTSNEEAAAIQRAFADLNHEEFGGARAHLRASVERIQGFRQA